MTFEVRYNTYDPATRTFTRPMTEAEEKEAQEIAMFAPILRMFQDRDARRQKAQTGSFRRRAKP